MDDDLLFTLELVRKSMPSNGHPVHIARLYLIERIVKRALEQKPDYWRDALADAERLADEAVMRRLEGGQNNA